jgi:hypothetical protein
MNDYFIRYLLVIFQRSYAQRLAAQLLGRFRFVVAILAGKLETHIGVRSLSLGQVSCSRVLGLEYLELSSPVFTFCFCFLLFHFYLVAINAFSTIFTSFMQLFG